MFKNETKKIWTNTNNLINLKYLLQNCKFVEHYKQAVFLQVTKKICKFKSEIKLLKNATKKYGTNTNYSIDLKYSLQNQKFVEITNYKQALFL